MTIALGVVAVLLGAVILVGQAVSVANAPLARRLGLQEGTAGTDPVYRRLELETARWDLLVLWTLPLAGVAMLVGASWWPWTALIAGGASVDTGGREVFKIRGLRAEGVRVGTPREARSTMGFDIVIAAVGLALALHALVVLA